MPRCIGRSRIGGICHQRIISARRDDRIMLKLFHSKPVIEFSVCLSLGKNTGDFPGLERHAVTDKQNDILCFL